MEEFYQKILDDKGQEYTGKVFINGEWIDAPNGTKQVIIKAEDYPLEKKYHL